MSTVKVGENENVESALRRFKRKCSRDGIIGDLRKKEFYEKPSRKKEKEVRSCQKKKQELTKEESSQCDCGLFLLQKKQNVSNINETEKSDGKNTTKKEVKYFS